MQQPHFVLGVSGRRATLTKPFVCVVDKDLTIVVPAGFSTDFASVPRIFWSILPPWGPYAPAAIVHDYLYVTGIIPKKQADDIFLKIMKNLKVSKWKRNTMYQAVKLGGGEAWDEYRKKDKTK